MNGEVGIGGGNGTISLVEGIGVALWYILNCMDYIYVMGMVLIL